MSVGNCVRKIGGELNSALRMSKFIRGLKPQNLAEVLCGSRDIHQLPSGRLEIEKFHFIFPKIDINIKQNIIEPEKTKKINFELPIRNGGNTEMDLPFHLDLEISEPVGKVIKKEATHMIIIRRRKMRKHKRKKFRKKFAAEIFKRKLQRKMEKEASFQAEVKRILKTKETFSAEQYVTDLLEKANWVKPVTRVKGRLAPQWVIKEHLEEKEEKRILQKRINECLQEK